MSLAEYYRTTTNEVVMVDTDSYAIWVQTGNNKVNIHYPITTDPLPTPSATQVVESHIELDHPNKVAYRRHTLRNKTADELRVTWTAYEFLNRFTGTEREAIRTEAKTNPNVADFLMLATAAQVIISDDPITIAGMGYLVSIGLITDQRKNQILDGSL